MAFPDFGAVSVAPMSNIDFGAIGTNNIGATTNSTFDFGSIGSSAAAEPNFGDIEEVSYGSNKGAYGSSMYKSMTEKEPNVQTRHF